LVANVLLEKHIYSLYPKLAHFLDRKSSRTPDGGPIFGLARRLWSVLVAVPPRLPSTGNRVSAVLLESCSRI
jgi:hypothetical protein